MWSPQARSRLPRESEAWPKSEFSGEEKEEELAKEVRKTNQRSG